jgi:enamine deaminase RidA (YjgF/YER057c/UK114 family)
LTEAHSDPITRYRDPADFSPFPVAARAGNFVFAPCVANLQAADPRPLDIWRSRHEARSVLQRLGSVMAKAGGTLDHVVSLLQCFHGRGQTAGYVEERQLHFLRGVPTSTGTAATRLATPQGLIQLDAIGIIPSPGESFQYLGGASAAAKYSNALSYRDLVFFAGVLASEPETHVDPTRWFGSAVKNELRFIMQKKLYQVLRDADCSAADIAVAHIHLLNPVEDLGPLHEVIEELFPTSKPVFMVSPSSGLGSLPARIEITPLAVRPGGKTRSTNVEVPGLSSAMLGGPHAKRVGDLVFIGTQHAADATGRLPTAGFDPRAAHLLDPTALEMNVVVDRLEAICKAAGASAAGFVRLRLYVSDISVVPAAVQVVRRRLGDDVPLSVVEDASSAGWLGNATISADGVLFAPIAARH